MRRIIMTAFGRPEILRQTLQNLAAALQHPLAGEWGSVLVGFSPGDPKSDQVHAVLLDEWPFEIVIDRAPVQILNCWNLKKMIERAFSEGAEQVLVLEDDILLSPDALALARFYHLRNLDDCSLCLCLFNDSRGIEHPGHVERYAHFCPWGWAISRRRFEQIKDRWMMADPRGWDFSIVRMCIDDKIGSLRPKLSRSTHNGPVGMHFTPELHAKRFAGHKASTAHFIGDYHLVCA